MDLRLITIAASHYCEKARWALERSGLAFKEEAHVPMMHYRATLLARTRTVPVLVTPADVFTDSTAILAYVDGRTPESHGLYPTDAAHRQRVETLEDQFDEKLGPAVRRLAYFYLLDDPEAFEALLGVGAARGETLLLRGTSPVLRALMRRGLRVNEEGVSRSRPRIEAAFDTVGRLLSDGRPYLTGDAFTAADLTFAALTGPLLFPEGYGGRMFGATLGERAIPAGLIVERDHYRNRIAGRFALRLYRDHRREKVPGASA